MAHLEDDRYLIADLQRRAAELERTAAREDWREVRAGLILCVGTYWMAQVSPEPLVRAGLLIMATQGMVIAGILLGFRALAYSRSGMEPQTTPDALARVVAQCYRKRILRLRLVGCLCVLPSFATALLTSVSLPGWMRWPMLALATAWWVHAWYETQVRRVGQLRQEQAQCGL